MPKSILVVGGGWSGLAAATKLSLQGHEVKLLEAAPQLGGRARSIKFNNHIVDNGQHIFLGAYTALLDLLNILQIQEADLFARQNFYLYNCGATAKPFLLQLPKLPRFLKLITAAFRVKELKISDKLALLQFGKVIYNNNLNSDCSVLELLQYYKQPQLLINSIWAPLCLAALTTAAEVASAKIFLQVLYDAFFCSNSGSDFLLPKTDLSNIIPKHCADAILQHGGSIDLNARVKELIIQDQTCIGVKTKQATFMADRTILATPPHTSAALLQQHQSCASICANLQRFAAADIITAYLEFTHPPQLPAAVMHLNANPCQWLITRKSCGQAHILAAVISAPEELQHQAKTELLQQIINALYKALPQLPPLHSSKLIREKQAAFSALVNLDTWRPQPVLPLENCFLAGDYLQPYYPATLESALRSGLECAKLCISS